MTQLRITPRHHPNLTSSQRLGKFVTFEGLDGSGKSTQLGRLASALNRLGIKVVVTREPGGTQIGEKFRDLLLDVNTKGIHPCAELALMFASRAQLVAEIIKPALRKGIWVLCDRFVDSSEAYQGGGRELGSHVVLELHRALLGGFEPDLTILLDHDIADSVSRARARNAMLDGKQTRFEEESRQFFERVQKSFRQIGSRDRKRVFMIDAKRPMDAIHEEILAEVLRRFLPALSLSARSDMRDAAQ
jgi:dTMP kinase